MVDFDSAKEAINLSKHGVSLARWVDLEIQAIVVDDRFNLRRATISGLWIDRWSGALRCFHCSQWSIPSEQPSPCAR